MKNLIIANWKCNPTTKKQAEVIFNAVKSGAKNTSAQVVICPPFVYIPLLERLSSEALNIGGQNVFFEEKGAFTGEVSPVMLKDLGVEYVIIGHSERRKYFHETDESINKRIKKSLESGLKVIFCIGETAEERDAGRKNEVLEHQIKNGLAGISKLEMDPTGSSRNQNSKLAVAYEPVWAIGTGNNCSVEETKQTISFIRELFARHNGAALFGDVRILYGGSVKSENSGAYIKEAEANGLLVGGASLNAEEFVKIIKSAE